MTEDPEGEPLARFRRATVDNDIPALLDTLTEDAELVSPVSGRMVFRGHADLTPLLTIIYRALRDLRWTDTVGTGDTRVLVGEARFGPFALTEALVLELAPDGRVRRLRPHLRPLAAVLAFTVWLGPAMARYPAVIRRAAGF
ncbi:nuclear transport factor 2 family protein [Nocardia neocaledoniensis]|uniref:nuclear transport factor 2 family protein n=1 Tax=Nocardia neocaledoniensis TaxID=236511 RepID=UPI002456911E|nr:nuclear transport factor 2 family protein [Nocardia neocaledoniensis]